MLKYRLRNLPQHAYYLHLCQLFFVCAAIVFSAHAYAQNPPIKIIVFGDSLTSGYQIDPKASFPLILERKLQSMGYQVNVINMSIPGETTTDARKRINSVVSQAPDLVLMELGINDAIKGLDPKGVTARNLNYMLNLLKEHEIGILLCGTKATSNLNKKNAALYEGYFYSLAKTHKASLYPDVLKGLENRPDLTLADGMHPNENGVLTMVQNMTPIVESLVKWRIKYKEYKQSLQ